jgi:hypothetical protein
MGENSPNPATLVASQSNHPNKQKLFFAFSRFQKAIIFASNNG